jgi:hypothetical protein
VTWSGGSTYYFRVFAYLNGQVKQVLDEASKLAPEVLYDSEGRESILITEPEIEHKQRTSSNGITTIFKWNGERYNRSPNIPWKKRFCTFQKENVNARNKNR